jgi:hypothetical protein
VVEVDLTTQSSRKFPIYSALEVPEIWQYNGKAMRFLQLVDGCYIERQESQFIPIVKPAMLVSVLEESKTDQTLALRAFRQSVRESAAASRSRGILLKIAKQVIWPYSVRFCEHRFQSRTRSPRIDR